MQTLNLLAPQRDEPGASDLIGLFVDHRRLDVAVQGLSYAGVCLAAHQAVKRRRWRQPPVIKQNAQPFVNFMWTDFEAHGNRYKYMYIYIYYMYICIQKYVYVCINI